MSEKKKQVSASRKVIVLSTGGTIEKSYDASDGSIRNRDAMISSSIIARLRLPHTQVELHSLFNKDSLDMTEDERQQIIQEIERRVAEGVPIVVIHGTDTLHQTCVRLLQRLPRCPVAVVFTGAMVPVKFEDSDARQNVTEALVVSKILPPGVYLSFHGEVYRAPDFRKNRDAATFEIV